jgi:hypothetical protein
MEIKERYVDGIGKIHFVGQMIRFDLFSFVPSEGDNEEKPEPKLVERLVMSPNGFLASYEAMVNMVNKLTEAGILSKVEPAKNETATVEPVETAETTETAE